MKAGERVRVSISFDNVENYSPGIARALNGARGVIEHVLVSEEHAGPFVSACVRFDAPHPRLPVGPYTVPQVNYWLPVRDLKKE